MLTSALLAAAAALALQGGAVDTTVAVQPGTRLDARVSAGSIRVRTWDRPAVRIVARPRARSGVAIRSTGSVLTVAGRTDGGVVDVVELEITAPRRMDLTLGRGDVDITVTGTEGEVDASNHAGTISVDGGRGVVALRSTLGAVMLRGARARMTVRSTHESVTVSDAQGDLEAESSSKHVTLSRIDSRNVRASSVGGVVRFSGPFHPDGRYSFASHMGSVWAWVPPPVGATVSIATVEGGFSTDLPYTVTERTRRGIFTATIGSGSAQVQMESFSGGIVLRRLVPGGGSPEAP